MIDQITPFDSRKTHFEHLHASVHFNTESGLAVSPAQPARGEETLACGFLAAFLFCCLFNAAAMSQICCLPGCYNRTKNCTLFKMPSKNFLTGAKHSWAKDLEKIIIRYRSDGHIKELFNRDLVKLCQKHFLPQQYKKKGSRFELIVGAIPSQNMPVKSIITPSYAPRAPPKERQYLPKMYHKDLHAFKRSCTRYLPNDWIMTEDCMSVFLSLFDDHDQPKYAVEVDNNLDTSVYYYGGKIVDLDIDIRYSTVTQFLHDIENRMFCKGMDENSDCLFKHVVTKQAKKGKGNIPTVSTVHRPLLKVERGELAEIEHSIVQSRTIFDSGNDTTESKGTIIPLDEIPTSAVPASCLGGICLKRVYKKETRPKRRLIANPQSKFSRGDKEVTLPGDYYPVALLHHDYIKTMSELSKDYLLSKEMVNETHYAETNRSNSKTGKITKQVKEDPGCKTRQRKRNRRKRGSLMMDSGKTKLERNLYCSHLKHVQMEKGRELLDNDVETCLCSQADDDTLITSEIKKQKFDSPPSGNNLKRPKRRRKRLSLYGGRTKLERNPPAPSKPANSAAIKDYSIWNGVSNLSENLSLKDAADTVHDENHLMQSMYSMQKSGTFCDFTIIVSSPRTQRRFPILVHRLVFASVSNKIKNHIGNILDAAEYCNKLEAQRIVEFVYTGKMEWTEILTPDAIERLHRAAVFLEIPKCVVYLKACKEVHNTSIAKIGDYMSLNNGATTSFKIPPLDSSSLDVEVFDIAENLRIERDVSVAADATDTSPQVMMDYWILSGGYSESLKTQKGGSARLKKRRH